MHKGCLGEKGIAFWVLVLIRLRVLDIKPVQGLYWQPAHLSNPNLLWIRGNVWKASDWLRPQGVWGGVICKRLLLLFFFFLKLHRILKVSIFLSRLVVPNKGYSSLDQSPDEKPLVALDTDRFVIYLLQVVILLHTHYYPLYLTHQHLELYTKSRNACLDLKWLARMSHLWWCINLRSYRGFLPERIPKGGKASHRVQDYNIVGWGFG